MFNLQFLLDYSCDLHILQGAKAALVFMNGVSNRLFGVLMKRRRSYWPVFNWDCLDFGSKKSIQCLWLMTNRICLLNSDFGFGSANVAKISSCLPASVPLNTINFNSNKNVHCLLKIRRNCVSCTKGHLIRIKWIWKVAIRLCSLVSRCCLSFLSQISTTMLTYGFIIDIHTFELTKKNRACRKRHYSIQQINNN